jgi:protocatechuate 3,4-dioxygenase beta subunit
MNDESRSRRRFLGEGVAGALLVATTPLLRGPLAYTKDRALKPTPSNSLGPYYKKGAPRKDRLTEPGDAGLPLLVGGQISDTAGRSLSGAIIEVWQTNSNGEYDLEGWRYRATLQANNSGEYRLETVLPGHYGDRAQHIHYLITAPGHRALVTQLYFATDSMFDGDPDKNFGKKDRLVDRDLVMPVTIDSKDKSPLVSVKFNICLEAA